ncbi:MAG: GAF domain-containing sensor histidine kinase, partial [Dehalococcoidia bacterium]
MASQDQQVARTFDQLSREQLEIYAREFQEHFDAERRLRRQLEDRNRQLEQRLQEIAAIEGMNQTINRQNRELSQVRSRKPQHPDESTFSGNGENLDTAELSVGAVLQKVVDLSRELVHANYSGLVVLEDGQPPSFITSGLDYQGQDKLQSYLLNKGIQGALSQETQPVLVSQASGVERKTRATRKCIKIKNLLGIPIVHKGHHTGNLYLVNKKGARTFSQEDASLMVMFATQAAVAIENARIYYEIQSEAVLEERDRIGKDLHDNIIQSLYAVGLNLEDCADLVMETPQDVKQRLHLAVDSVNDVIRDTRDYIMDLRSELLAEETLQKHLEALVGKFTDIGPTEFALHWETEEDLAFSPSQVPHLLAIAREGLTNVIKHASAQSATLGLSSRDGKVTLWIQDDGVGFALKPPGSSHPQGLRNMKERAEALGG